MRIRTCHYRLIFFLVFICSGRNVAFAFERVQFSKEPSWLYRSAVLSAKIPSSKDISDGYYLELIDHQVNVAAQTEYRHIIRHVVNETGVQNVSEVSISYSPSYQKLQFYYVRVIRNGAIVSEAAAGDFKVVEEESDSDDFLYSGMKRAYNLLKDVRKDDKIEFAYSLTGFNPVFRNRFSDVISFMSTTAVVNRFETLILPSDKKLFFKTYNRANLPVEEISAGTKIYRWTNPLQKIWQSQPGVPSWFNDDPYVRITEYENWQQVVDWGLDIFGNYQMPLSPAIEAEMGKWKKAAGGDDDVFASLALRFVQDDIRYLGLEIGENTHQPHAPADVFRQRFGDCKDKALLLSSIFQKAGIPAYVALVNTNLRDHLKEIDASPKVFDHAIVAVQRNKDYFFIDPTAGSQRGEFVNTYVDPYGYALIIKSGESDLRKAEPGFLNEMVITEELRIPNDDTTRLYVNTVYSGGKADNVRQSVSGMSEGDLDKEYLDYYSRTYDGIEKYSDLEFYDDSVKNNYTVNESYTIPTVWQENDNGKKYIPVFAKSIYMELPDPSTIYKNGPIAISYPVSVYYTLTLNMPSLFTFPQEEIHVKNDSYKFDFRVENKGNIIKFIYSFKTYKDHIPKEEFAKYKQDYKKIMQAVNFSVETNGNNRGSTAAASNLIMYVFVIFVMVLLGFLLRYLNGRSAAIEYFARQDSPVSGWLIFLAIGLAVGVVGSIFRFMSGKYFDARAWENLHALGGAGLQGAFMIEAFFRLLWLCGSVASLYWLIQKRDIFPSMFIWYVGTLVVGHLVMLALYVAYPQMGDGLVRAKAMDLAGSCIYGFLWVSYILRSEQVKETFTRRV